ncbi:MAG: carboxymuconolactone decarboxylase family protein [Rhizobacter sp.]|nr:carboxymuconolactone decarboxylase family protein [Bacteriovorax sp.]
MKSRLNFYPRSPEAFAKMGELGNIVKSSSLDKHILHLVNLRASQINGCAFCVDMHVKEAAIDKTEIGLINFWNRLSITFRSTPGSSDKTLGLENSGL